MKIIVTSSGYALWFENNCDLDHVIEQLRALKKERGAKPSMSWPAFLCVMTAKSNEKEQTKYWRGFLRWLRARLHKDDVSKFSD